MMKLFAALMSLSLSTIPALQAHVVDIHIPTASEIAEEERREQELENEKNWEIFNDEDRSEEERRQALYDLNEAGEIS